MHACRLARSALRFALRRIACEEVQRIFQGLPMCSTEQSQSTATDPAVGGLVAPSDGEDAASD